MVRRGDYSTNTPYNTCTLTLFQHTHPPQTTPQNSTARLYSPSCSSYSFHALAIPQSPMRQCVRILRCCYCHFVLRSNKTLHNHGLYIILPLSVEYLKSGIYNKRDGCWYAVSSIGWVASQYAVFELALNRSRWSSLVARC